MRSCGVSSLSPARLEGCSPSPCQEEVPDTSSSEHRWRPLWEVRAFPEAWAVSSGQVGPRWPSEQARPSVQTQDKKDPALAGRIKVSEELGFVRHSPQPCGWHRLQGVGWGREQSDIKADAVLGWQTLWVASQDPDPCWTRVSSHIGLLVYLPIQQTSVEDATCDTSWEFRVYPGPCRRGCQSITAVRFLTFPVLYGRQGEGGAS